MQRIKPLNNDTSNTLVHYNAIELNNTKFATKEILYFNRLPKVGSSFLLALIKKYLAPFNSFKIKSYQKRENDRIVNYDCIHLNYKQQVK